MIPSRRTLASRHQQTRSAAMSDSLSHAEVLEDRLARAAFATFMMIAAADRKVDQRELATLEKLCSSPGQFPSELFRTAIVAIARNPDRYFNELQAGAFHFMDTLGEAIKFLEQERPDEAQAFKESLMAWGRAIAEAPGGFVGLGKKMGKAEAATLAAIAGLIDLHGTVAAPPALVDDRLARAPLLVFKLVAAADGTVDRKEREKLALMCKRVDEFSSPLFRAAVRKLVHDYDRIFMEMQQSNLEPVEELEAAGAELDASYPEESVAFKQCLMRWGRGIAEASGGVLGVGSKTCQQEALALKAIAASLGLVDERGKPMVG